MSDGAPATSEQTTTGSQLSQTPPAGPTAEEVAELRRRADEAEQWRQLALSNQATAYPAQQPAQQRAFPYQEAAVPQMPPSSLLLENPEDYDRRMQAYLTYRDQQTMQTVAGYAAPQFASTGKFMSQNGEYRDVWQKWPGEVERLMVQNNIPPHAQTKDAWDLVARLVKADHVDDYAKDRASQMLQGGGFGTEGSGTVGGAPAATADALRDFWDGDSNWVQRAKASGMTLSQLRDHIRSQHLSEKQWVEDMKTGRSFSAEIV